MDVKTKKDSATCMSHVVIEKNVTGARIKFNTFLSLFCMYLITQTFLQFLHTIRSA